MDSKKTGGPVLDVGVAGAVAGAVLVDVFVAQNVEVEVGSWVFAHVLVTFEAVLLIVSFQFRLRSVP